jgi:hypothetical protein
VYAHWEIPWEIHFHGLVRGEIVDRTIWHDTSRLDRTTEDLQEDRNRWRDERHVVDGVVAADSILDDVDSNINVGSSREWLSGLEAD